MKETQFVTDDKGRKTAALIDLKEHGKLWEDFYDSFGAHTRLMSAESLETVKEHLKLPCTKVSSNSPLSF